MFQDIPHGPSLVSAGHGTGSYTWAGTRSFILTKGIAMSTGLSTELTLKIAGMSCGGCVRSVSGVLSALPGVERAEVSLERGEANVRFDAAQVTPQQLLAAIDDAGFEAALPA